MPFMPRIWRSCGWTWSGVNCSYQSARYEEAGRILPGLITELTVLATATTVTKRRAPDGAPQTSPLFGEAGLSAANDG
jgi:hypothetical protein